MCGIFGWFSTLGAQPPDDDLLVRMAAVLRHRGPDEGGVFASGPIALGSRRLSIIDLEHGRQPLADESGDLRLVCNGEIYNAPSLRRDLERRHRFRTHSDVEVLIHLYEEHGTGFLTHVEGMFALALWDSRRRELILARDRMGEKPLYHATHDGIVTFASELSALRLVRGVGDEPDPAALRLYLALGHFPAPHSPYRGIHKLRPGSMIVFRAGDPAPRSSQWWSLREHARRGAARGGSDRPDAATVRVLRETIERSVAAQLMADVPLGVALSGGLDSAVIDTLAAGQQPEPRDTFTVAFPDPSYDEHAPALALATRIGAVPHVVHAGHMQLMGAIERLGAHMDEPLGDPAVLPTFLLAEEARRHVKVMLGGEGADELFGGYPTYPGHQAAVAYARCPRWLRRHVLEPAVRAWPSSDHKVTLEFLLKRFVNHAADPLLERHSAWFGVLPPREAMALAGQRLRDGFDPREPVTTLRRALGAAEEWNDSELAQVMTVDALFFLGEGLLTKLDRVCMSCSLESRSPYLGRDVVELAAAMPVGWKVRGLSTKWILREATRDLVPRDFLARRKRGLSVPLA